MNLENLLYENLPTTITNFISENRWNKLDFKLKEYYYIYLNNPNHFFFRSNFLHIPKKKGSFNEEEIKIFYNRLNYFKNELNLNKIPWGYFSIILNGRSGYQCAAFYREQIILGKISKDFSYPITKNGFPLNIFSEGNEINCPILEKELFEIVNSKINFNYLINKFNFKFNNNNNNNFQNTIILLPKSYQKYQDKNFKENDFLDENILIKEYIIEKNPLSNFIDPLSNEYIKIPMIDINGFLMDKSSWEKCLINPNISPCNLIIKSLNDLIFINNENFSILSPFIINL